MGVVSVGIVYIDKTTGQERRGGRRAVVAWRREPANRCVSCSIPVAAADGIGELEGQGGEVSDGHWLDAASRASAVLEIFRRTMKRRRRRTLYAPWWLFKEQLAGSSARALAYHIEFGGGRDMPSLGTAAGLEWLTGGSYGRSIKEDAGVTTAPSQLRRRGE